nr:MAG TPA: hypothetical protein [Caudoviricetes sp.]
MLWIVIKISKFTYSKHYFRRFILQLLVLSLLH